MYVILSSNYSTTTMKVVAVLFSVMAVATAFAPMPAGRANTELKKTFWDTVSFDRAFFRARMEARP